MAMGAVLAAALTDHSVRGYTLTVAGNDLVFAPGSGQRVGVDMSTVQLIQRGPGLVSELVFTIDDPLGVVSLARNQFVQLRNAHADYTLFSGFLTTWTPEPWAPSGRSITCRCSGVEIILDWAKVGAMTIPAATRADTAIQAVVANVLNGLAAPLLAAAGDAGHEDGSETQPVANLSNAIIDDTTDLTINDGTTLREAIRQIGDDLGLVWASARGQPFATVDPLLHLHVWWNRPNSTTTHQPFGWGTITVADTAGGNAAADLRYAVDAGSSPVAVDVQGTGISAIVTDGTGDVGDMAVIADATLTTAQRVQSAGLSYLAGVTTQARASLTLETFVPDTTVHPGSLINVTDALLGLTAVAGSGIFYMMEIAWTFHGNYLVTWEITMGGSRPSMALLSRRFTRATLS